MCGSTSQQGGQASCAPGAERCLRAGMTWSPKVKSDCSGLVSRAGASWQAARSCRLCCKGKVDDTCTHTHPAPISQWQVLLLSLYLSIVLSRPSVMPLEVHRQDETYLVTPRASPTTSIPAGVMPLLQC